MISYEETLQVQASCFQHFNIPQWSEAVAADTIFCVTMAQLLIGKTTLVVDVYPLKSTKQFVNTLVGNICS